MKAICSLLLLCVTTFGASAIRHSIYDGEKPILSEEKITPARATAMVKDIKAIVTPQQKSRKASTNTIGTEEIEALNVWACYSILADMAGYYECYLTINVTDEATGAVEIILMDDSEFTLHGFFNGEENTFTIPNNQYLFDDENGQVYFYFKDLDDDDNVMDGRSEAEYIVGTYNNGVVEFPIEYIWAFGYPESEHLGWYLLTADNTFITGEQRIDHFENAYLCPDGKFNENLIYSLFTQEENTEFADVEVYSNGEGFYKVVNPFKNLYAALGSDAASPDMIIDATDPDNVYIDLQTTGITGGADGIYSYASYTWYFYPEEEKLITKTVDGNKVTITFPYRSTLLLAPGTGTIYYGSVFESTLTFTEDTDTAVEEVESTSEETGVYYNLQGVRVEYPEGLVIRVQGDKVTKLLVR